MAKQVLIIHGGTTFDSHADYLSYLSSATIDKERLKPSFDWKHTLQADLKSTYEVLTPRMPNSTNAQYGEWKLWFENIQMVIHKEIILIGHSLGGIFLTKYLSEHLIENKISKLILIAAPYKDTPEESLASFKLKKSLTNVSQQVDSIFLMHSTDDPVVPYDDVLQYQKEMPNARLITLTNAGHCNLERFPELVTVIKS